MQYLYNLFSELHHRDGVLRTYIVNLSVSLSFIRQSGQSSHCIGDMAETSGLFPGSEHPYWFTVYRGLNESWDNHAVLTGLSWSYDIEEADNSSRQLRVLMISHKQEFVDKFAACV